MHEKEFVENRPFEQTVVRRLSEVRTLPLRFAVHLLEGGEGQESRWVPLKALGETAGSLLCIAVFHFQNYRSTRNRSVSSPRTASAYPSSSVSPE